jgi:hypothetical protein
MGDEQYSPQAAHPDPTIPAALIAHNRAAYYGSVPPWPMSMIGPSGAELARWSQLWSHPRAPVWVETSQELAVATLVRVEQRCARSRPSPVAQFERDRLRGQLGLTDN